MTEYESYKCSSYDWLGNIPFHWTEKSIRQITKVISERLNNREMPLLSVYREYGVILKNSRDDNHNVESNDLSNYKVVRNGNLVLNKMKMWQGSLGVSKYDGVVSPAYIVCKITDESINVDFLHLLLRSAKYKTYYNQYSYGVRVGQWDMHYDDFKNMRINLPPRAEQDQIVRFLDWKVSEINKLINIRKQEVIELKNLMSAIIEKAITKGMGSEVTFKKTGIYYLPEIPDTWELLRLKHICKIGASINQKLKDYTDQDKVVFTNGENFNQWRD